MIDISLLRIIRVRSDYNKVKDAIKPESLDQKTRTIIKGVGKYFEQHQKHGQIDFTAFIPFMDRTVLHNLDKEEKEVYRTILTNMAKNYPDEETRKITIQSLQEHNFVFQVFNAIEKYNDGVEIDVVQAVRDTLALYDRDVERAVLPIVDSNIDFFLDGSSEEKGIKWRLDCLNEAMRPLVWGDFGIIAARPDQGKTSFICSELTHMASQLPEGEHILWFNNEGAGYRLYPRLMQAALSCTTAELISKKEAGVLYEEYNTAMRGKDRVKIMDVQGYNYGQIESILEQTRPAIVVYDMIDNIHGFASAARTDLALEMMYQWARECSTKYKHIALATSQISQEGADDRYPSLACLKDSKTGKQGACDFQLMIGSMESKPEFENTRWLSLPKNKLRKLKSLRLMEQVVFDKDRARYKEIKHE